MRRSVIMLVALLLAGCDAPPPAPPPEIRTIEIEGCEYLEYDYGMFDQRVYSLTHKGNCRNPIHAYVIPAPAPHPKSTPIEAITFSVSP